MTEEEKAVEALLQKDVNLLTVKEAAQYLYYVAKKHGLDPSTHPFDFLTQNGKRVLYANAGCADQIREKHNISIEVESVTKLYSDGITLIGYIVTKKATMPIMIEGMYAGTRTHVDAGAAGIGGLTGDALANAIMRAHTKAERRVTLGIKGLGIPDISEVDTIQGAKLPTEPRIIPVSPGPPVDLPETKESK